MPEEKTAKASAGFSAEEKAAMKDRALELKADAKKANGEKALLEKVAEMSPTDRAIAERLHAIIKSTVPGLSPKTWYGMPAYATSDGKVLCFFQSGEKFGSRYCTFGFQDVANLDDGAMWPTSFALKELNASAEETIVALLTKAMR